MAGLEFSFFLRFEMPSFELKGPRARLLARNPALTCLIVHACLGAPAQQHGCMPNISLVTAQMQAVCSIKKV